jgi:AAA domain
VVLAVPIFERFARGWPEHVACGTPAASCTCTRPLTERDDATYADFAEATLTRFAWDAHFSAYSIDATSGTHRRMTKKAIKQRVGAVAMVLFVVDVEPEGHAPRTPAWDESQQDPIANALAEGAYFYETRGGYRLVWKLAEPFPIANEHDEARWTASYKHALDALEHEQGVIGDRTCADWTRMYRLPLVTRDGIEQHPEVTDVHNMGEWAMRVIDVPAPKTTLDACDDTDEREPASDALMQHIRERLAMHGPAVQGQGGDKHTFQACAMLTRGYALPETQIVELLDEWNPTCVPPWPADELRTKLDNAYNFGAGDIGDERKKWESNRSVYSAFGVTPPSESRHAEPIAPKPVLGLCGVMEALALLGEPQTWDVVLGKNLRDAATSAHALATNPERAYYEHALAEVNTYNGTADESADFKIFFKSARELFAKTFEPPRWLVEGIVLEGGTAMIGAEPKAAKTWAGTEIALALATGTKVFGKYVTRPTSTAYLYTEDMETDIKSRVRGLLAGRGLTVDALGERFIAEPRGRRIDITKAEHCAGIIASVRLHEQRIGKIGVLVFDPLRNIHMNDEDKSGEMVVVFEHLKMIGTLLGCTIIVVHHSKKANGQGSKRGGQKLRGSSAIHGFLDCALYLSDTKTGDDGEYITNAVESETKAGRSAGSFELTIRFVDDPITRACVKATWEIGRKGETAADEDKQDSWRALAIDICGAYLEAKLKREVVTSRTIKTKIGGSNDARQLALKYATNEGWLRQDKRTQKYELTASGEEIVRERNRPQPLDVESDPPAPAEPVSDGALSKFAPTE